MSSLVWSPVYRVLEDKLKAGDKLILLVVPFIKLEALKQLLWAAEKSPGLKIVVRWQEQDILAGVSDLEIYPFLKAQGITLYFNPDIHLKLYVFQSNAALNTSGNLTLSGLGYKEGGNVEVGNMVELLSDDWQRLFSIIDASTQVDDDVYNKLQEAVKHTPKAPPDSSRSLWPTFQRKQFTIQTLPATETPDQLIAYYLALKSQYTSEEERRFAHDLAIYKIEPGLEEATLRIRLAQAVRINPFVKEFIDELKSKNSMSFGLVTAWLHEKCEDVPVPYRWEIKDSVRILYNWLQFAFPEVTWDIPRHSQVIYWNRAS